MSQPFELAIEGMHCQACVRRVKAALAQVPGVVVDEVTIGRVRGALDGAEPQAVASAITAAGFTPAPPAPPAPPSSPASHG